MISFVDLRAQYRALKPEIDAAVLGVLESGQFVLGPEVAAFEAEFAAYVGAGHCVGVNTGTSALHLALLALGVGPGDEVITTPFTFVATVAAIRYTGATPVFVDVDPRMLTIDPAGIPAAITPRTKVILPVHLHGHAADMDPILELARNHGLAVVEDAAQAVGAEYHGRRVGSLGDIGCFSFYPGKNLGACGEGGAVTTTNPQLARTVRLLRDWGAERKYEHVLRGYNYRLEAIQASILRVKLRYLDGWTEARRTHAALYCELLGGSGVGLPSERPASRHVYHVFAVRATRRALLQRILEGAGVQTNIHYPIPVHLQQAHADLGYQRGAFPYSERAADELLSLPMYPELTDEQIGEVARAVHRGQASLALEYSLGSRNGPFYAM